MKQKRIAFMDRLRHAARGCAGAFRHFVVGFRKILARLGGKLLKHRKGAKIVGIALAICAVVGITLGAMALCISAAVCNKVKDRIVSLDNLSGSDGNYDCVLVLGCGLTPDGGLSAMLKDRVLTGIEVLEADASSTLLVSGDHRTDAYNEVGAMKNFAVERGIPSERIFQDHDGYSTYDSMIRLRDVYGARKVVIVTQEYHLYRALYLAQKLGIDAVGVPADRQGYAGQTFRELREILARCKDVIFGLKQPPPEVQSIPVSLDGNGDLTNESRPRTHSQ